MNPIAHCSLRSQRPMVRFGNKQPLPWEQLTTDQQDAAFLKLGEKLRAAEIVMVSKQSDQEAVITINGKPYTYTLKNAYLPTRWEDETAKLASQTITLTHQSPGGDTRLTYVSNEDKSAMSYGTATYQDSKAAPKPVSNSNCASVATIRDFAHRVKALVDQSPKSPPTDVPEFDI